MDIHCHGEKGDDGDMKCLPPYHHTTQSDTSTKDIRSEKVGCTIDPMDVSYTAPSMQSPIIGEEATQGCCCRCHAATERENTTGCNGTDTVLDVALHIDTISPALVSCPAGASISSCSGSDNSGALSPVKSITSEKICRICLDAVEDERLIAPCKCSGSTKYAHEACLLQWFFRSRKKSCELCLGKVNVKPVGFKPMQEWRLPEKKCDFIVYLFGLYFLIMLIFTGMITWIATQGCTSPVCVTLYTVCGVALVYFVYCCGCVEYSRSYWRALLSVNRIWRIYGREDSCKSINKISSKSSRSVSSKCESTLPGGVALRFQTPTGILSFTDHSSKQSQLSDVELKTYVSSPHIPFTEHSNSFTVTTLTGNDNLAVEYDEQEVSMHISESTPKHFPIHSMYEAPSCSHLMAESQLSANGNNAASTITILSCSAPYFTANSSDLVPDSIPVGNQNGESVELFQPQQCLCEGHAPGTSIEPRVSVECSMDTHDDVLDTNMINATVNTNLTSRDTTKL